MSKFEKLKPEYDDGSDFVNPENWKFTDERENELFFHVDGGSQIRFGLAQEEGDDHYSILMEYGKDKMTMDFYGNPNKAIERFIGALDKMIHEMNSNAL